MLQSSRIVRSLWLCLLGGALLATVEPGLFTIDEPNYLATLLATRAGLPHVPGVEALPASDELAHYDPVQYPNGDGRPKLYSPPLYAFIALPFAALGLHGLFLLNVIAFCWTVGLVFRMGAAHFEDARTPWLLAGVYAFGAYNLEYAQAVWPHMLSVALCTTAFACALRAYAEPRLQHAALAGLLVGMATGVRYQNVVYGVLLGLGLLLWARRRLHLGAAFALGMAGPIAACSVLNHFRFGSYNPIAKSSTYLSMEPGGIDFGPWEPLRLLWTRLVDYSAHPAGRITTVVFEHSPHSPAYVYVGAVKKAWMQSIPWVLLSLGVLALSLRAANASASGREPPSGRAVARTRLLRTAALICFGTIAMFAVMGFRRIDGICFNQRYFLELVPLVCLALGGTLDGVGRSAARALALGAVGGGLLVVATLYAVPKPVEEHGLLWLPLLLGCALLAAYMRAASAPTSRALAVVLGACVAWSAGVHFGDDLRASRQVRRQMARGTALLDRFVPKTEPSALFVLGYWVNAAAPLQLDRPLLIADALRDETATAPALARGLLRQRRRVFVHAQGFRPDELSRIASGSQLVAVPGSNREILELLPWP